MIIVFLRTTSVYQFFFTFFLQWKMLKIRPSSQYLRVLKSIPKKVNALHIYFLLFLQPGSGSIIILTLSFPQRCYQQLLANFAVIILFSSYTHTQSCSDLVTQLLTEWRNDCLMYSLFGILSQTHLDRFLTPPQNRQKVFGQDQFMFIGGYLSIVPFR